MEITDFVCIGIGAIVGMIWGILLAQMEGKNDG